MKKVGWLPTFIKEDMTRLLSNQLYKYILSSLCAVFTYHRLLANFFLRPPPQERIELQGSRTTRPEVKECIRSDDQEATMLYNKLFDWVTGQTENSPKFA